MWQRCNNNGHRCVTENVRTSIYQFSLSLFRLQVHKKRRKQDIKVVQNVILEVDKQHVLNTVTIATAHSREEQSHTPKTLPLTHTHKHAHTLRNTYFPDIVFVVKHIADRELQHGSSIIPMIDG